MNQQYANAYPRKSFFIEMFTKDISLEDCILDLIDNSIDGMIRSRHLKLSSITNRMLQASRGSASSKTTLPWVKVFYSQEKLSIEDNCGGIDLDLALTEAFNFGHSPDHRSGYLGAYGVGLKRALFKIGNEFLIKSKTLKNGFSCHLKVPDWLQKDDGPDDWRIPVNHEKNADGLKSAGTVVEVFDLHDEVKMRLRQGTIEKVLYDSISKTYSFFLDRFVHIYLNGVDVVPFNIPLGNPKGGSASFEEIEENGVKIRIFATMADPGPRKRYTQENSGWYIVCNGRVVLPADKSEMTGWGTPGMPTFHDKYRGFVGVVSFEAEDPSLLPWTTTKRALNSESRAYIQVRSRMVAAARPVINFLNKKYPSDPDITPAERDLTDSVTGTSLGKLAADGKRGFKPPISEKKATTSTRVQYNAEKSDLDKIRTHLRKPDMHANRIGEHTFKYFMDQEGLS